MTLWGTGTPRREFLHVDDLAAAACFVMENYEAGEPLGNLLNVESARIYRSRNWRIWWRARSAILGRIRFDPSRPDGTPRKLLDVSRLHSLGWRARIKLGEGIAATYEWYFAKAAPALIAQT